MRTLLARKNGKNGKPVDNSWKTLWITRDQKVNSMECHRFPIVYPHSYPHLFLNNLKYLTTQCHTIRAYNSKKQQLYV